ncbi:murein L,D-transpeptidase catalytic domain family protein [Pseudoxanthomonas sp. PXM01]|uniref:murein L,D-transpeptidase catalytic domain family protein n=1 Tax=Pseudoxanthomonas sp. PXM01 TaxID=2769295 RepID=UPI0017861F04|nr:murein L,D-transpeptidase catalytic domain family protein [Pseudoxanthomonas sp. PXM01]MBD9468119.1 murein L,D-transpeptidase catalytic domain family protein [Pseudoxanthomonas sp. PXM01]
MSRSPFLLPLCLAVAGLAAAGAAHAESPSSIASERLVERLHRAAPSLDRDVLSMAARAMTCSIRRGEPVPMRRLSVIDYSLPSTQPRLWVFDLEGARLLFEERVAHGRNTGENLATRFSNATGSYMSSLGAFVTQESYRGANGYSLRLQGLEPGFNDKARERAIVIHGAPYVSEALVSAQGRLGRSLGCPAVRAAVAQPLIDSIRGGSFLFAYYPDPAWLKQSRLLGEDCGNGVATHPVASATGD